MDELQEQAPEEADPNIELMMAAHKDVMRSLISTIDNIRNPDKRLEAMHQANDMHVKVMERTANMIVNLYEP